MKLSIVSTLYRSGPHLAEFHRRIGAAARAITADYEIVLVNDDSPGDDLPLALSLRESDPRVRVIDLARNFGEHKARITGLRFARGEWIFLLPSDLEIAPEMLSDFWRLSQRRAEVDLFCGVQAFRRGNRFERFSGEAFYRLFNRISPVRVFLNPSGCYLMSRRFSRALLRHREQTVFFAGLCALAGFRQAAVPVFKTRSHRGSYRLWRRLRLAAGAVFSFSAVPAMALCGLGTALSLISLITTRSGAGFSWVVAAGGSLVFAAGVTGIYLHHVLLQLKRRPYVIVRHHYESSCR